MDIQDQSDMRRRHDDKSKHRLTLNWTNFNIFDVARASTKRPRERSTSPGFDDASTRLYGTELESEEGLLSFSDLIRPLSATPSPEPSLHFGTPPRMFRINNPGAITSSDYESSIIQYVTRSSSHEEEGDEVVDDSAVAEMRKTVVAWGLASKNDSGAEPEQSSSSRNRQLAMMVMALTHPARPTASQVAAQAEHIRALLAERSVIMQQLEDMSEFRNADRLGFERTAQALNARVVLE
ncbi:hypothetical protein BDV93DRAFT_509197 [Ceratobasidium sp. AG-I]|nr:hypothetical protein BDV93DRAFT_509197 [Ceratobasidium sp. AG-I]